MSAHYLDKFFNPSAIAVIGASSRTNSVGMKVFANLLGANFAGQLYPVNPKHTKIQGYHAFPNVLDIPHAIDLAIITTPAQTVPIILDQCGKKNIKAAVIISAGFSESGNEGKEWEQSALNLAHHYNMRLIGPNCLGLMRPACGLNATFNNTFAMSGSIALVSQSGAICAAILDWAIDKRIGLSAMVSLGNAVDLDFGEILDFLAVDAETKSILLYIEGIHNARRFMSGLRAAARMKPVIVIKGGRLAQGSRAAYSHTGALVGDDDAFDAALRQAGAVRVMTIKQLFSAAEILSSNYRTQGNRLAIITNGGGAGVMAADRASELNIPLAPLNEHTITQLNQILPRAWSHQNPIDILGDATPERYHHTVKICAKDENIDGLLNILIPVAMSNPLKVAKQLLLDAKESTKPIIACWMGEHHVKSSWELFAQHNIPCFSTPEEAIEAFSYLAEYHHNQQLLLQVPEPRLHRPKHDVQGARLIIESVLGERRNLLSTMESKAILKAFAIPITSAIATHSANEALIAAETLQFPVVMKINSPDITHKQDAGGVKLNIEHAGAVRDTYHQLIENAKQYRPDANITGVTVEKMYKDPNNREVMIGVVRDKVFGPVITFGAGGTFVEIIRDRAVALPPLNPYLANHLIDRTRIAKLLGKFRNMLPANTDALLNVLLNVSAMVCELPYIREMDINPLLVNDKEAIAVDVRIVVDAPVTSTVPYQHMAICPYPSHLSSTWQMTDSTHITIRPIRPEDAQIEQEFVKNLSPQSRYFRFMEHLQELTLSTLIRFTQIDYDREMAFIATCKKIDKEIAIGVARYYMANDAGDTCEFGLVIADAWQNKGLGTRLMKVLQDAAKHRGVKMMRGEILAENKPMLDLVENLGFTVMSVADPKIKIASKQLT
ncbi:bifunctional acetate--CoA ligase family protein/GNAT family N-acetyltransferase [Legionella sp. 27cVA30]|uniref:Bifunctional acyl-CoA synthetase/GNAT family N-acetyltransferase n=1 Tax=Legionella septentrionalis TaxID=2498109 RepID=A0A3S0VML8_9GAMM|nr:MULTISPECIES: bifunctional acetate--CoA ligase family protein/GNAT family N-acetyltransferase [Legionella]MCP0913772.1 bifunctional acetate--CoA ligase family protein/GNAT family N-acetyltransferase [Legionella sp. 27cVA30]RUQ84503.1 bifunctional acyl-CoA synthetase/GNAT family N-acetyltransferase [Legionella septentrionalis]RUR14529.1 bifunctional acyl-CoA synthetase/GNAT family N-acetyltransferase [Legionella septentrionalis]